NYPRAISFKSRTGPVVPSPRRSAPLPYTTLFRSNIVCTISNTRNNGTLTVVKSLSPSGDPGLFNLQIDGATAGTGANVGNAGSTGANSTTPRPPSAGETAGPIPSPATSPTALSPH